MFELIGRAQAAISFPNLGTLLLPESTSFSTLATRIVNWILVLAGMIAVIYLIYGGILYITAGGDAEKATKGRTAVINAVIGIAIILLALVIVQWVARLLKVGTP